METVVLKSFDSDFSANIILTRLQDNGIRCFLTGDQSSGIYPVFNNSSTGAIRLSVHMDDEVSARLLLSEFEQEYINAATCPICQKNEFSQLVRPARSNKLPLILAILDHITAFIKKVLNDKEVDMETVYVCGHCKYETTTLPANTLETDWQNQDDH
jgi:hypothetical protein